MDFRLDENQLALQAALRTFCERRFDLSRIAGRDEQATDPLAWQGLADIGVLGLLVPDVGAELGLGGVEAVVAFEELGSHLVSGPVLWSTIVAPLVEGVAGGGRVATGVEVGPTASGQPIVVDHASESDVVVVVHPDKVELLQRDQLPVALPGHPVDPLTPSAVYPALPSGEHLGGTAVAERLRLHGTVLAAAALVGVGARALEVARSYALEREQFGVAVGSFQAVKHMLADAYVRTELARSASHAAGALLDDPGCGDAEVAASAAKLLAGESAIENSRMAVQVLGGMGFTWAMLPHRCLKRAWVLETSFGSTKEHALRIGSVLEAEVGSG